MSSQWRGYNIDSADKGGQSTAQTVALSMFRAIGWVLLVVLITLICYRHKAIGTGSMGECQCKITTTTTTSTIGIPVF